MNGFFKQVSLWVVFLIIFVLLLTTLNSGQGSKQPLGAMDFAKQLEADNVSGVHYSKSSEKGGYTFKVDLKNAVDGRKSFQFKDDVFRDEWRKKIDEKGI